MCKEIHHDTVMSTHKCIHIELGNLYMGDAYDFDTVESALLTRGWQKKCCMLAVADHIPWATLSVLLGSNVTVIRSRMVTYI